ncbi:hypothetical protein EPUS_02959 [Endocarpon pusillum Z07020]|uniref:Uncharacterized protein n=1 Tax=Endocarpon pusillum (strain Z07020 / HMAS-L-300199) TaxID=1263415 RepID=U1GJ57_ENDPU|nr:uncharacterized protein EPUS_02959 [Endocarpon pusillum Z07020]ERF72168.1 hypothetical protein EPUS_02959 [Endocarpon pusillum Z07020]
MTSSTTLMTFLVQTPPSIRSVNLLGSWDNFSKPYPMKRDSRLGAEHWSGCYNFENIVCDGRVEQACGRRQGGLKMGGRYWYHYQLDNDIEFHNPAEPSTTACPMLPGQPVNVLDVPMHFSTGHRRHRNASVSSTSSELMTMNPEDRYLNPRPAPKPALATLNTSARQNSAPSLEGSPLNLAAAPGRSRHGRNASLPLSAVSLRTFRLPRKASIDSRGRSVSPHHISTGLKAAFRQFAPLKPPSPEAKAGRGRARFPTSHRERLSLDQAWRSNRAAPECTDKPSSSESSTNLSRGRSPTPTVGREGGQARKTSLVLRQSVEHLHNAEAAFAVSSFQSHRRQRSRSREPSPLRTLLTEPEQPNGGCKVQDAACPPYQPLETLKEVTSAQNTPIWPSSGLIAPANELCRPDSTSQPSEKRLPTLPNTPLTLSPNKNSKMRLTCSSTDLAGLTTGPSTHFSHWTVTTDSSYTSSQWSSIFFDGKSPASTQETEHSTPSMSPCGITSAGQSQEAVKQRESSSVLKANRMPSVVSSSTISSYDNPSPSSPISETSGSTRAPKDESTLLQKRYGMMLGSFDTYRLPAGAGAPDATLKPHFPYYVDGRPQDDVSDHVRVTAEDFPHTTTMQQIMQELSYLKDMIQD